MVRAFGCGYTAKTNNPHQIVPLWIKLGRFVKNHLSNRGSKDDKSDYSGSESFADTMDDLDDIFNKYDGDFDESTIFDDDYDGYDGDSEDDE